MAEVGIPALLAQTSGPFRGLCLLLVLAFLLGGGARADIQSLMFLRPAAILLLFYGIAQLQMVHLRQHRFLFAMALAVLGLLLLHLVPLPPAWWSRLPGRDLVVAIDRAAGLGAIWRPLSMAPDATLNALYATMVPFAALVLGAQLEPRERGWLLWPILALGALSALLGLAQLLGGADDFLRFYKVTNEKAALGLFANRNHQALLLAALLPMLAVWAYRGGGNVGRTNVRVLPALLTGTALIPLILVTGSRAGLILAVVALLLVPLIFVGRGHGPLSNFRPGGRRELLRLLAIFVVVTGLATVTWWLGRGFAVQRLLESSPESDMRLLILPTMTMLVAAYLPFGSGLGSFVPVYQIYEPDNLLDPSFTNHAHNDFLELAMTGGIPAMVLMLVAAIAYFAKAGALFRSNVALSPELRLARLGCAIVLVSALASLGDYPLRVPSLACLFVVAIIWMSCPLPKNQPFSVPS